LCYFVLVLIYYTYYPPTNAYGTNYSTFTFLVADNSGTANNESTPVVVSINIARTDLPPIALDSIVLAPDVGNVSFALTAVDPQGYSPLSATVVVFPASGILLRSDNTTITPSSPTVSANGIFHCHC
jgi:hypothetical protein